MRKEKMVLGEPEGSISTDAAAFTGCWCHHTGFSVPLGWGWGLLFFFPSADPSAMRWETGEIMCFFSSADHTTPGR